MKNKENILELKTTRIFTETLEAKTRIIVNQGGTRSSKTFSIAQVLFYKLLTEKDLIISIVRETFPALRATAMRDFITILKEHGFYSESNHDKTNNIYKFGTNEVEFFSIDDEQKIRGRKRDYLWINESNEISEDKFIQLILRTTKQIYLDYNPSIDENHWIVTNVLNRDDITFIKSTYLDNPFLEDEIIREINRLKILDPSYWQVYGLGERSDLQIGTVFNKKFYSEYDILPNDIKSIIYCDPNLAIKSKGDKTAIIHFGYSPSYKLYYVINAVCKSFADSNELLSTIYNMRNQFTLGIAFDGNFSQESTWTNLIRNWQELKKIPYIKIDFKRYKVDDLAKNIQFAWNQKQILFPSGFNDNVGNKIFLYQLFSFVSKKLNKSDDAPDALICAYEYINQEGLTKSSEPFTQPIFGNSNNYNY